MFTAMNPFARSNQQYRATMKELRELSERMSRVMDKAVSTEDTAEAEALAYSAAGDSSELKERYLLMLEAMREISAICADHVTGTYLKVAEVQMKVKEVLEAVSVKSEEPEPVMVTDLEAANLHDAESC